MAVFKTSWPLLSQLYQVQNRTTSVCREWQDSSLHDEDLPTTNVCSLFVKLPTLNGAETDLKWPGPRSYTDPLCVSQYGRKTVPSRFKREDRTVTYSAFFVGPGPKMSEIELQGGTDEDEISTNAGDSLQQINFSVNKQNGTALSVANVGKLKRFIFICHR